jgi:hypothetical protein
MNYLLNIIALPLILFGIHTNNHPPPVPIEKKPVVILQGDTQSAVVKKITPARWEKIYDSARLQRYGLKKEVFQRAYTGYQKMAQRGLLNKQDVLTICDFGQSYRAKRLYVIDLEAYRLVINTLVAHGQGSGGEYPNSFGNEVDSHKSSLGFYTTAETYYGEHGFSLRLRGREAGINDNAYDRDVVVHASEYVSEEYLRENKKIGRSWGCPAIPEKYNQKVINLIRNGSCFFIHHPAKQYLKKSKMLG